jgi:hypothetical protein
LTATLRPVRLFLHISLMIFLSSAIFFCPLVSGKSAMAGSVGKSETQPRNLAESAFCAAWRRDAFAPTTP